MLKTSLNWPTKSVYDCHTSNLKIEPRNGLRGEIGDRQVLGLIRNPAEVKMATRHCLRITRKFK